MPGIALWHQEAASCGGFSTLPTYNRGVGKQECQLGLGRRSFSSELLSSCVYLRWLLFSTEHLNRLLSSGDLTMTYTVWGPEDKYSLLLFVTLHWQALGLKAWEWGHLQTPVDEGVEVFLCNCLSVLKMLFSVIQKSKGVDFFTLSVVRKLEFHYWVK